MEDDKIWSNIDKAFGGSVLFKASEVIKINAEVVPTPSASLNDAIGFGGIPLGKISQLMGEEGSGKTFFAMLMVARFQKQYKNSHAVWIDAEHSFDPKWAKSIGVDLSRLKIIKENDGAKVFTMLCGKWNDKGTKKSIQGVLDYISTGELDVKLIVLDSIAQLIPPVENGRGFDEQEMAALARFLPKAFRVTSQLIAKTNTAMICINQAREKLGERFPTLTYPGGRSYRHSLSLAVQFTSSKSKDSTLIDDNDEKRGHMILAKVEKTRGGPDKHRAEFFFDFNEGVVNIGEETALLGVKWGVIERPNLRTWVFDGNTYTSKADMFSYLEDNPDEVEKVIRLSTEAKENGAVAKEFETEQC